MNRLHSFSAVTKAIQYATQGFSIPFFLVSILTFAFDGASIDWIFTLSPIGFVLGAVYGVAEFYRFSYGFTEDTFDVASGVFSRRDREIPYRRIQNVDVSRGLLARLLGVAVVSIETAGGGETEATLRYVADGEAGRLQREIRTRTAAVDETSPEDVTGSTTAGPTAAAGDEAIITNDRERERPVELFSLDSIGLAVLSLTTVSFSATFLVAFGSTFLGEALLPLLLTLAEPLGGPAALGGASPLEYVAFAAATALYGAGVTYLVGVAITATSYYGFRLGSAGEDLVHDRGLLRRYSGSIPVEKIQTLTLVENLVQRAIGYAALQVETAGYGPESGAGSQSAIPIARRERVEAFLSRATGVDDLDFERPPAMARRRYLVRYSLLAAAVVAVAFGADVFWGLPYWYVSALALLLAPVAAHLRWANLGYARREDHLLVREGFWRRRTHVVPDYRLQTVSTRRSLFQRRLGLASVVIDTASSRTFLGETPVIHDRSLATARSIHADCRSHLEEARRTRAIEGRELSVAFTPPDASTRP